MKQIVNTNIRLDLSRADDRQAYEYLRYLDRKQFKSYTRAVVYALNDSFSRQEKRQADPYLETREKEDRFLGKVLDTIRAGIQESMSQVRVTLPSQPEQVEEKLSAEYRPLREMLNQLLNVQHCIEAARSDDRKKNQEKKKDQPILG